MINKKLKNYFTKETEEMYMFPDAAVLKKDNYQR